jgi:4-amino-4-deoxy-L-arabinose transferase-like glycosyltransferase
LVEDTRDPADSVTSREPLNRSLDLTRIPLEALGWIAVTVVALGISLIGRTNWPLSEAESAIARDAWALLQGNDLSAGADAHPAIVQLTAFAFFLFGDSDFTARLVPLLGGLGVIATLYWLRSWFGSLAAFSTAIVWAISPVMSLSLMRLDGGAILVLCMLMTFVLTISIPMDPDRPRAIILGIALGLGLTVHPLGWIVLPLTFFGAALLIRDVRLGGQILSTLTSFLLTVLVITTWFATRLTAPVDFLRESLSALVDSHLTGIGSAFQAPFVVLLTDEPALLVLVAAGLTILLTRPAWSISVHPAVFISCIAWAIPLFTVSVLLGIKGPALYTVGIFPLIVVAGLGLAMLLDGVRAAAQRNARPWLWGGTLLGLIIAIVRFTDSLAQGPEGDITGWIVNVSAVGVLILAPLGYLIVRLSADAGWLYAPVAVLLLVAIVGGIGLRTSLLLPDTSRDRPGELLRAGNTAPAVGGVEQRLRTYSRDATMHVQDVRDPTGGHGLMIVVQRDLADPVAWYFRDFPNLSIVEDPADIPADIAPDVGFIPANEQDGWSEVFQQHEAREYRFRYVDTGDIQYSVLNGLILSALNPGDYRNLFRFSIYRSNPEILEQESFTLLLRDDHSSIIWGGE